MRETAPITDFTVADLARRWRVGEDKVRGFLRRGELVGFTVATSLAGKPQYRITPEAVRQFEARRTSAPTPKPQRRRRAAAQTDYYAD